MLPQDPLGAAQGWENSRAFGLSDAMDDRTKASTSAAPPAIERQA
jgi:hypothetical protein